MSLVVHCRGGAIPEITMRYVSRYLSHDTIRITIRYVSRYFVDAQTNRLSGQYERSLKTKGLILTSYCVLKQYHS